MSLVAPKHPAHPPSRQAGTGGGGTVPVPGATAPAGWLPDGVSSSSSLPGSADVAVGAFPFGLRCLGACCVYSPPRQGRGPLLTPQKLSAQSFPGCPAVPLPGCGTLR